MERSGRGDIVQSLCVVSLARQRKNFPSPTSMEIIANWTGSCLLPPTHTRTPGLDQPKSTAQQWLHCLYSSGLLPRLPPISSSLPNHSPFFTPSALVRCTYNPHGSRLCHPLYRARGKCLGANRRSRGRSTLTSRTTSKPELEPGRDGFFF